MDEIAMWVCEGVSYTIYNEAKLAYVKAARLWAVRFAEAHGGRVRSADIMNGFPPPTGMEKRIVAAVFTTNPRYFFKVGNEPSGRLVGHNAVRGVWQLKASA